MQLVEKDGAAYILDGLKHGPILQGKIRLFQLADIQRHRTGRYPLEGIILKCPAMVLYRNNSALDTGHLSFVDLLAPAAICTAGVHILTEQHLFRLSL